jgi:hypothetical protein
MLRRLRKWWLCRRYGICPVHGVLRPHGGYNEGQWGICPKCHEENAGKNVMRDWSTEKSRYDAVERLNADWALKPVGESRNE